MEIELPKVGRNREIPNKISSFIPVRPRRLQNGYTYRTNSPINCTNPAYSKKPNIYQHSHKPTDTTFYQYLTKLNSINKLIRTFAFLSEK